MFWQNCPTPISCLWWSSDHRLLWECDCPPSPFLFFRIRFPSKIDMDYKSGYDWLFQITVSRLHTNSFRTIRNHRRISDMSSWIRKQSFDFLDIILILTAANHISTKVILEIFYFFSYLGAYFNMKQIMLWANLWFKSLITYYILISVLTHDLPSRPKYSTILSRNGLYLTSNQARPRLLTKNWCRYSRHLK